MTHQRPGNGPRSRANTSSGTRVPPEGATPQIATEGVWRGKDCCDACGVEAPLLDVFSDGGAYGTDELLASVCRASSCVNTFHTAGTFLRGTKA